MLVEAAKGFGLGQVVGTAHIDGGLSNDMWRVTTTSGDFAVKVMRAHVDAPDFRGNIEAAFAIEMNAFRAGIPCPEPKPTADGHALLQVGGDLFRAHRWCDGSSPGPEDHLVDAGRLLARIHRVGAQSVRAPDDEPRDAGAWAATAQRPGLPEQLADQLRSAAPDLAVLEAATAANGQVVAKYADSHGDLDPKNALVAGGRLLAVDWDAAGSRPVAREAVSLGLDWAGNVDGFCRVLRAYADSSASPLPKESWVFGGWVAGLSGWLQYNVEQRAATDLGLREASVTCDRLVAFHRMFDEYLSALQTI